MPVAAPAAIRTLTPPSFLRQFSADPAALSVLQTAAAEQFFVVAVEEMYPLFTQPIPPVRATAHSCLLVTSGAARMRIGAQECVAGPGEVLLVRAGQLYSFAPGDVNTGLLCHFHDDFLRSGPAPAAGAAATELLRHWGAPLLRPGPEVAGYAEGLLGRLLAEYRAHGRQYPELLRAYLLALLQELARAQASSAPATPALPPADAAGRLAESFQQLVASSLAHTHRVRDYAARLHVTPDHLARCVRRVTGKSPARWIEEAVVREARALLAQSRLTVAEVALEVGVADASYFSRLFRKHTGLTPLAYRQQPGRS